MKADRYHRLQVPYPEEEGRFKRGMPAEYQGYIRIGLRKQGIFSGSYLKFIVFNLNGLGAVCIGEDEVNLIAVCCFPEAYFVRTITVRQYPKNHTFPEVPFIRPVSMRYAFGIFTSSFRRF